MYWPGVLALGALSVAAAVPPALQPTGSFHAGEAVARDGERWLALRVSGGDAALVPTRVRVHAVHDALVDDEGQASGEAVEIDADGTLMLLRGAAFQAGRIEAAQVETAPADGAVSAAGYRLVLQGSAYSIRTRCTPTGAVPEPGVPAFACELQLEHGGHRQALAAMSGYRESGSDTVLLGDDASPHLLFAGDLDRDGRLDLIFDVADHYNVSRPTLFLSSAAGSGEMVRAVAHHESVGC